MDDLPKGATVLDGKVYDVEGRWIERVNEKQRYSYTEMALIVRQRIRDLATEEPRKPRYFVVDKTGVGMGVIEMFAELKPIGITITGGNATTWELSPAVWRQVIEVNLVGSYLTCRSVVPHMIKAGYGRIINIASIAGKEGNPNASHYSASKAGLIGWTKSLGKELARTGVLVNAVTPAAAKTPMFDSMKPEQIAFMLSKIPMGRFLEVDEAASMIGWLASEDCAFSTGAVFDLSGGRASY